MGVLRRERGPGSPIAMWRCSAISLPRSTGFALTWLRLREAGNALADSLDQTDQKRRDALAAWREVVAGTDSGVPGSPERERSSD